MNQQWNRRKFLSLATTSAVSSVLLDGLREPLNAATRKMNVLFISIDDLRPTLGCYGDPIVQSPNIDKLAARGMVFTRTYCQYAMSAVSRNSILTGRRPDTLDIYDFTTNFRTKLPNVVTLPQQFKRNGYHTEGMGKIFHTHHCNYDDVRSWSVPSWPPESRGPLTPKELQECLGNEKSPQTALKTAQELSVARNRPPVTGAPANDRGLKQTTIANHAIERLSALKAANKPFFLAVGIGVHLPFIQPKQYWDLYNPAQFKLEDTKNLPMFAPYYAGNNASELRSYSGVPKTGPIPDELVRQITHAYYARVSYADAQIGRVLNKLDQLGLREQTIVILWSDHGFHLGDHGLWAKHTNYEQATRSPMIVSVPGMKVVGQKCNALTELVDIYPSLCELASIPKPNGLEGTSFAPLLNNPKRPWKKGAFSQYRRKRMGLMGRSLRTARYRLTEWTNENNSNTSVIELYDYQTDPQETINIAGLQGNTQLVANLKSQLRAGWRAALPPQT
ncbi:sulfatase [Gloeocapsopsis dulcis]|nr:sulfatase [Gloeocapsopsis dulcis]WNN88794.1 sulfatase [Gloeocapsopsis dulcis]